MRTFTHSLLCCSGALLLLNSCTPPAPISTGLSQADRDAITAAHKAATAPAHSDPMNVNWDTFAEMHYAPDAMLLPANRPAVEGREAMVQTFKSWPPLTKFHTEDVEIEGSGDLAYVRGTYELAMQVNDSTTMTDKGKYIEIWKKQPDGSWRSIRDIWNSDMESMH